MQPLVGLILCGGQSSRMGEDKSQIRYHAVPQWQYLAELIRPFCHQVLISCSAGQVGNFSKQIQRSSIELVPDAPAYVGRGPITGLLSAWDKIPGSSLLVVGCDYPLLTAGSLTQLTAARKPGQDAVCFQRKGFDEPLVAVYEETSEEAIRKQLEDGQDSLRRVLKVLSVARLFPLVPEEFNSIDTPEQRSVLLASTKAGN